MLQAEICVVLAKSQGFFLCLVLWSWLLFWISMVRNASSAVFGHDLRMFCMILKKIVNLCMVTGFKT